MKILAINGSPRKNSNEGLILDEIRKVAEEAGVEFEVITPGSDVRPCMACYQCLVRDNRRCVQKDCINDILAKCEEADGILLTSPVYHGNMSGTMKVVIDRVFLAGGCGSKNIFAHKAGAALCTVRRSGGSETYMQMLSSMASMDMVLVTSDYWNIIHGADPGEALKDEEGMEVALRLAKNLVWMVKVLNRTKEELPAPESAKRPMMNFIR